jgi:hypothetical protein
MAQQISSLYDVKMVLYRSWETESVGVLCFFPYLYCDQLEIPGKQ